MSPPPDHGPESPPTTPTPAVAVSTDVQLPSDFASRIRALQPRTLVHIPLSLRARATKAWAECLEGIVDNLPGWASLEEGRSKLLFTECLPGVHNPTELGIRMAMWENRDIEGLLTRLEADRVVREQAPRRRRRGGDADERTARR